MSEDKKKIDEVTPAEAPVSKLKNNMDAELGEYGVFSTSVKGEGSKGLFSLRRPQNVVSGLSSGLKNVGKGLLYYVNDSDGNTILYDKTIDDIPFEEHYPDEHYDLNITHSITPKKGRVLFFDGRHYHAPSSPSKSMRCVITLDLFGNFQDNSYSFPVPKIYKITYS